MALIRIRLELARCQEFPEGSPHHGYIFAAPLTADGLLDREAWPLVRDLCKVHRFWQGQAPEDGRLVHRGSAWYFDYDNSTTDDDEPIFKFDRHHFVVGDYVSITEHDGVQRPFRVVDTRPL